MTDRVNFTKNTRETLAKRVNYRCLEVKHGNK